MMFARVTLIAATTVLFVASASAQTVSFYFTKKGSTTAINSVDIGQGTGSQADVSVWAKVTGTFDFSVASAFLKYDTTTAGDPLGNFYGTPPTLQNNKIRVAGGPFGITNGASVFNGGDAFYANAPGSSPFDFGMDIRYFVGGGSTSATTALRLFDVRLENIGLAAGSNYTVSLLDRGAVDEYSTYLQANDGSFLRPGTQNLVVRSVVPEPGTIAILGIGGLALLRRRRARR